MEELDLKQLQVTTMDVSESSKTTDAAAGSSAQVSSQSTTGVKYDHGKARMDLLVPEADELTAKVLSFGADKYGAHNWRGGINYSRLHAALRRHLAAWSKGEELDPESGLPHLAHARCCLDFLMWMTIHRTDLDDRPDTPKRS